jgi:hypothetical protein
MGIILLISVLELGREEVLSDPRFDDYGRAATSIGSYATEVKLIWESHLIIEPAKRLSI